MRFIVAAYLFFSAPSVALEPRRPLHHVKQSLSGTETIESTLEATGTRATTSIVTPAATSTTSDTSSDVCSSQLEEISDAMPTEPPEYSSFSKSYYETHPRTADNPVFDCAWIRDLPERLDEVTLEDQNRTAEWFLGLDPDDDAELFDQAMTYLWCASENIDSQPCQAEFDTYIFQVQDRAESTGVRRKDVLQLAGIPACVLAAVSVSLLVF